jgi:hypothetical protein
MLDRREFLTVCSATGAGGTLFPGVLWAMAQDQAAVTREMIEQAEKVAGVEFTDAQRDQLVTNLSNCPTPWRRPCTSIPCFPA